MAEAALKESREVFAAKLKQAKSERDEALRRVERLEENNAYLRAALVESHGSYRSLVARASLPEGTSDPMRWDGPLMAEAALSRLPPAGEDR
jgi:hypothetical protein